MFTFRFRCDSRRTMVIVALLVAVITGGCAALDGYPARQDDLRGQLAQLDRYFADDVLREFYVTRAGDPTAQRDWRDEVVHGRLRAIDLHYAEFVRNASGRRIAGNTAADLAVLGLSAAGSLVPAAETKAVLAAISGGVVGARGIIDREVFYEKTLPLLLQAMEAGRNRQLARIHVALADGPERYSLLQALADVEGYYHAGTFPAAIVALSQMTGAQARAAELEFDRFERRSSE